MNRMLNLLKKEYPKIILYLNFNNPLELMVGTILSAQCTDESVNACTRKLFKKYRKAEDYANVKLSELQKDLSTINFYNNKAKSIQNACRLLVGKHNGKVPFSMKELIELPGIARKTANVILQNGFGIVEGVVVDTHVLRVAYRLGWTTETKPEKVEQDLMRAFPKKDWKLLPFLLKSHGRAVCKAPTPLCSKCILKKLCPKKGVTKQN